MGCNCKVNEAIIGIVILILAFWPTIFDTEGAIAGWIIVIAAVLLILNSLMCRNVYTPAMASKASTRKRR